VVEITDAVVHAFYLFDVAAGVDLPALERRFGPHVTKAQLIDKEPGPPRVKYAQPPVVIDGPAFDLVGIGDFRLQVKFFDYGVVSLRLSRRFAGSWAELVQVAQDLIESEGLEQQALTTCRAIVDRTREALVAPRTTFLSEDYLVFAVHGLDEPCDGAAVLERHALEISQMLRGERARLSAQERDEVLRHRLSYLAGDLVIPAWNAAFVLDNEAAAAPTLEILELVNSQLLEFRFHDEELESELGRIYKSLQQPRWTDRFVAWRHARATVRLHALFVDVNELTDRLENAVKLVGDVYSARLFGLAAARLGLDAWKRNVEQKMKTLDDIYRFAVEQTGVTQGNTMEFVIVLILLLELGLLLAGLMK